MDRAGCCAKNILNETRGKIHLLNSLFTTVAHHTQQLRRKLECPKYGIPSISLVEKCFTAFH